MDNETQLIVEEQDARLEQATARLKAENAAKDVQIAELQRLRDERRALLERMRVLVDEMDKQETRIERDVERVLARTA